MDIITIERIFDVLFPICRSISGNGLRKTYDIISEYIPLRVIEFPTGKQCFDWTIPDEWNIKDAYIKTIDGKTVIDFKENNLHVMGYSTPINRKVSIEELKSHLHYTEKYPEAIPFVTSYYKRNWGLCLPYSKYIELDQPEYEVLIDSSHTEGSVSAAEFRISGSSEKEIVLFSHIGHPSMANDQLSGPLTLMIIADWLMSMKEKLKFTYSIVMAPETIGSIAYIHDRLNSLKTNCIGGYSVVCTGDDAPFNYRFSRYKDSITDHAMKNALAMSGEEYNLHEFSPVGCDERHFNSPGVKVDMGSIMRSMPAGYPGYHTSLDNKDFISFEALVKSAELVIEAIKNAEADCIVTAVHEYCEPKLDKYGLYPTTSDKNKGMKEAQDLISIWSFADGSRLSEIAFRLGINVYKARELADKLNAHDIIRIEACV